jgi:hypothetical protein
MAKQFTFRCPDDVWSAIQKQAKDDTHSSSAAVIKALRMSLNVPIQGSGQDDPKALSLKSLSDRMTVFEGEIARILELFGSTESPAVRPTVRPPVGQVDLSLVHSGTSLAELAVTDDGLRANQLTTKVRPEDETALRLMSNLSSHSLSKLIWMGIVNLCADTSLIQLIFKTSSDLEDALLVPVQQQVASSGSGFSGISGGSTIIGVSGIMIEHCHAFPERLEFGGQMTLQFDVANRRESAVASFVAQMDGERNLSVSID